MILGIGDNLLSKTSCLVGLSLECHTCFHITETQLTRILGNDDSVEWIPLCNQITTLYNVSIIEIQRRTVWHVQCRKDNVSVRIDKAHFCQTAYDHLTLARIKVCTLFLERNGTQLIELKTRIILCNDRSVCGSITSHTTSVERTKGKLCSRLTNSLSSNHTNSLTSLNHTLSSKVTAVTLSTYSLLAFTGEN